MRLRREARFQLEDAEDHDGLSLLDGLTFTPPPAVAPHRLHEFDRHVDRGLAAGRAENVVEMLA
ncbi:MAG: hypothetical protein JO283_11325 [Bradyrhizobium sp.]|nr:hypothetical protein [Bradyrhizobium sp.]